MARAIGGFAVVRNSPWRRRRLLILCYHGVSLDDEHEWDPALFVTQDHLRRRLRALRDGGYEILPLADAARRLYDGTLPARSVALTFDDGTIDFEQRALPVLREFNAPATLYLTTYYCMKRLPVFNTVLSYVMWRGRLSGADLAAVGESPTPLPVATAEERTRARKVLWQYAFDRQMSADEKDVLVARVAEMVGVDYDDIRARGLLQIMAPETVRALPHDLVNVQLHTHRHRTPRDRELFLREMKDNAAITRALRGDERPLDHFCYPSGEYFGEYLRWLRDCGVHYATTCVPDLANSETDPLLLPRFVDTTGQSDLAFEAWASGFAALLPRRREYRLDQGRLAVLLDAELSTASP
jgi:peptidoglycan/xylan/chitin deacetylase (PgdA/CDA1 family)